jgi:hypothetical protein
MTDQRAQTARRHNRSTNDWLWNNIAIQTRRATVSEAPLLVSQEKLAQTWDQRAQMA